MHEHARLSRLKQLLFRKSEAEDVRTARVVGCTTNGAAIHREVLAECRFTSVVVEEAAEVLEAHIVAALNPAAKRLILIGDHKQLRPKIACYALQVPPHRCSLLSRCIGSVTPKIVHFYYKE